MKKILFALFALLLSTGAFAQDFNPEDIAKMQVDRIAAACQTTPEQTQQLMTYFVKDVKEMMDAMANGNGGFDMEGFQKRIEAQNKFVKSVLTEEQFVKYEEDQKKMMEQFGGGGF